VRDEPGARGEWSTEPGGGARAPGEGLPRAERLRRRADYLRCYREGRRLHGTLATLHAAPNREGHPRLGITASRKVGGAAVRQRLRRRVREVYRRWEGRGRLPAADLVMHLKPAASAAGFGELKQELERLLGLALRPPRRPPPPRRPRPRDDAPERPRA
jgi:ribonuclease P protein component